MDRITRLNRLIVLGVIYDDEEVIFCSPERAAEYFKDHMADMDEPVTVKDGDPVKVYTSRWIEHVGTRNGDNISFMPPIGATCEAVWITDEAGGFHEEDWYYDERDLVEAMCDATGPDENADYIAYTCEIGDPEVWTYRVGEDGKATLEPTTVSAAPLLTPEQQAH